MVEYCGVHHLAMVTSDMDATIHFWRDLLGMRLVAGLGKPGYRHYFFEISPSDMIAFFEWDGVERPEEKDHGMPVTGPVQFDHVSIGVRSKQDLITLMARLDSCGFWVSEILDHGFIYSIYAFDPNHIAVEFSCPVPGFDIRKTPKMKDQSPSKAAQQGVSPCPGNWAGMSSRPDPELDTDIYPGEGVIFRE